MLLNHSLEYKGDLSLQNKQLKPSLTVTENNQMFYYQSIQTLIILWSVCPLHTNSLYITCFIIQLHLVEYKSTPKNEYKYLTIILRNRAEYRLILSRRYNQTIFRKIEQDNCFLLFNKLITKLVTFLNLSVDIFSLHFFFPRTKLHIPPDICYLRITDIENIMTIFG